MARRARTLTHTGRSSQFLSYVDISCDAAVVRAGLRNRIDCFLLVAVADDFRVITAAVGVVGGGGRVHSDKSVPPRPEHRRRRRRRRLRTAVLPRPARGSARCPRESGKIPRRRWRRIAESDPDELGDRIAKYPLAPRHPFAVTLGHPGCIPGCIRAASACIRGAIRGRGRVDDGDRTGSTSSSVPPPPPARTSFATAAQALSVSGRRRDGGGGLERASRRRRTLAGPESIL